MASQCINIFFLLLILLFYTTPISFVNTSSPQDYDDDDDFVHELNHNELLENKQLEKLSHLKVYWHDITSGTKPTSMEIVAPILNYSSISAFGSVNMIDNPLTLGPKLSSKLVGRAQGFYASTSQSEVDLLMAMNFAITEGKYNGSTITILGRNPVFNKVREMPVIGGSGLFRFARGYAQLRTHWFSPKTQAAIVEYNIYVLHY